MAPLVFAMPGFEALAGAGAERPRSAPELGSHRVERFPNGELHCELESEVAGRDCAVLGTIAPPDERMTSLLLVAHTLAKEHAASVTALLPYLAYARQDRDEPGSSLAAAWTGRLLQASGAGRVVTVDVHSPDAVRCHPIEVRSLPAAPLFAAELRRLGAGDVVVVAPDEGGAERARALASAAGVSRPVVVFRKRRTATGVVHTGMSGELVPHAVVFDDILDTGGTLVSCCRALEAAGVEQITIFVTHGLFTGDAWRELWDAGVARLYTTDSVPEARHADDRVTVLALDGLLFESPA